MIIWRRLQIILYINRWCEKSVANCLYHLPLTERAGSRTNCLLVTASKQASILKSRCHEEITYNSRNCRFAIGGSAAAGLLLKWWDKVPKSSPNGFLWLPLPRVSALISILFLIIHVFIWQRFQDSVIKIWNKIV